MALRIIGISLDFSGVSDAVVVAICLPLAVIRLDASYVMNLVMMSVLALTASIQPLPVVTGYLLPFSELINLLRLVGLKWDSCRPTRNRAVEIILLLRFSSAALVPLLVPLPVPLLAHVVGDLPLLLRDVVPFTVA